LSQPPASPQSSSQPSPLPLPRPVARQEQHSIGAIAESQIDDKPDMASGSVEEESFALPNGMVRSFSENWPSLPGSADTLGRRFSALRNSFADEQSSIVRDSMPFVWPADARAEYYHVDTAMASAIKPQQMLPWLIGALGLAGVLVGLIYRFAASRRRSSADRWNIAADEGRIQLHPFGGVGAIPRLGQAIRDSSDSVGKLFSPRRGMDTARAPLEQSLAMRAFEERVRRMVDRRKRSMV